MGSLGSTFARLGLGFIDFGDGWLTLPPSMALVVLLGYCLSCFVSLVEANVLITCKKTRLCTGTRSPKTD